MAKNQDIRDTRALLDEIRSSPPGSQFFVVKVALPSLSGKWLVAATHVTAEHLESLAPLAARDKIDMDEASRRAAVGNIFRGLLSRGISGVELTHTRTVCRPVTLPQLEQLVEEFAGRRSPSFDELLQRLEGD